MLVWVVVLVSLRRFSFGERGMFFFLTLFDVSLHIVAMSSVAMVILTLFLLCPRVSKLNVVFSTLSISPMSWPRCSAFVVQPFAARDPIVELS